MRIEFLSFPEIDLSDERFRISREPGERLSDSIRLCGALDLPLLLREKEKIIPLFGHSRMLILKGLGASGVIAVILDELNLEIYLDQARLKIYRGEAGPMGRLKLIEILNHYFSMPLNEISSIARSGLKVPEEFVRSSKLRERAAALPAALREFIDAKDPGFGVVKTVLWLPVRALETLSGWIETIPMSLSVFRKITDLADDLVRRGGLPESPAGLMESEPRKREALLLDFLARARYPEYSSRQARADEICSRLRGSGIEAQIPDYFEGSSIEIRMRLDRGGDPSSLRERIGESEKALLRDLLSLL